MCTPPPPPPLLNMQMAPKAPPLVKMKKSPSGPSGDRQALLADIRNAGGVQLKPTKTNDRSAPAISGSVATATAAAVSHGNGDRSAGKFPTPSSLKMGAEAPVDFASELSRAINAQQNRTLKKFNGGMSANQSAVSHQSETRVIPGSAGRRDKPPLEKRVGSAPANEKTRPAPIGPKPAVCRTSNSNAISATKDSLSAANKETAGVSVKALRERLQNPPPIPSVGEHQRKADDSQGIVSQRLHQMSSAPSLTDGHVTTDQLLSVHSKAPQPPPLPAKPPSRKPSMQHRKNVADKFRTLKPQSVQQPDLPARSNRFRSNSSENLMNATAPHMTFSLDNGQQQSQQQQQQQWIPRRNDANGLDFVCANSHQQQQGHQRHLPAPPLRPDVAPPPPPTTDDLPQRLFGCRSSLNVPPPPPRGDSLIHDLERTFMFTDIGHLPPPPEFRHLRSVKRAAPKAPVTNRAY